MLRHRLRAAYAAAASKIPPLCVARKLVSNDGSGSLHRSETCFRKPSGHSPALKRRKRARGTLSQMLWPSPGKLFREARRASPQRQNNKTRANDGAGLPRLSRKLRPSPRSCFGKPDGPAPSAAIKERARTTARVCHGCRGSFGRRAESFLGKPDGPDPSVQTTGTSFRAARRARPKPEPSMILRVAKNGTRRARAGFLPQPGR